jgi:hypothetical protein
MLESLKRRFRSLIVSRLLDKCDAERLDLSPDDIFQDLVEHAANNRLLGRFSEKQVVDALVDYGVWRELERKGYPNAHLTIRSIDPFRQIIKIATSKEAPENEESLLCELRLFDAWLKNPDANGIQFEFDALVIDWLLFQNPGASFTSKRPPLPGQKYPGLGIMRTCMTAILDFAKQTGKEAVVAIPEYYHNAVLYKPHFRFFSPEIEGRFQALQKFLADLPLWEASHAVEAQRIVDNSSGEHFVWHPYEQGLALTPRISEYFESPDYRKNMEHSEAESRFHFA